MSSPSASTVAALDQAFSQLHIVPPIQSNPHAIPDSCSTTLSLSSLAFPRKVFKAWLRGGREKWVIIPDDATGGRAGDHGTGWIGLSLSFLRSFSTYYHLLGQRSDMRTKVCPCPYCPCMPCPSKISAATSNARAIMITGERRRRKKSREKEKSLVQHDLLNKVQTWVQTFL